MKRRQFLHMLSAAGILSLAGCALPKKRGTQAHVVVIGAGFGGATAARYLRLLAPEIRVTVIERERKIVTGPFCNAVIGGLQGIDSITHDPRRLSGTAGIDLIQTEVTQIDPVKKTVTISGGRRIGYDRLIVSPGIDMIWNAIPGYDEAASLRMPHAKSGGSQIELLRRQLSAMDDGGVVVIAAPPEPYRCPPGPYERASLVANYLKRHKPRSKILLLDAKDRFPKQPLFQEGWQTLYPGMIEWISLSEGGRVIEVDAGRMQVITEAHAFRADVANIIPPQQAGRIARISGLADGSGWCPVDQRSFESTLVEGIHVLGDSAIAGHMPKSGSAANAQAKVCAQAVVNLLRGNPADDPSLINTCYSLLDADYGISVTQVFHEEQGMLVAVSAGSNISPLEAPLSFRNAEANHARSWYRNILQDTYGTASKLLP